MNNLISLLSIILVFANDGYPDMKPMDYEPVIQRARISSDFDGRIDLRQCVRGWEMFSTERDSFFKELQKYEISTDTDFLILEIGSAGFGKYNYACIWKHKQAVYMLTNMTSPEMKIKIIEIKPVDFENLLEQMHIQGLDHAGSLASNKVDDGDCFFVTAKLKAKINQFAVYAPKSFDASEKIVNMLLDFIKVYKEGKVFHIIK